MEHKQFGADIQVAEGKRSFTATITRAVIDRDKEVLLSEGMDATDFEKTGTIFWNHDYSNPVGKATSLKQHKDRWMATATMVERPKDHPEAAEWFPDTLLHLMKEGIVRGVSVGFMPIESRRPSSKDKELFGDSVERIISKWKMNEFSITPMPANQDALITAVSKGILSPQSAKSWFGVDVAAKKTIQKVAITVMLPTPPRKPKRPSVRKSVLIAVAKKQGQLYL